MTARQLWFRVHSWLGLKLCVFMAFISLTGALATISQEIDWLFNPPMRATATAGVDRLTPGEILDIAVEHAPEGRVISLRLRGESWFAAELQLLTPWNERVRLWVNPYTGEYQGTTGWFNVQRFLRQTHRHLMMPVSVGVPIVSMLGVVLVLAIVSGLVVYKRFWRGFFKWPRWNRKPRVWLGDLHRLIALWTLWFVALIAITSLWYLFESLGGRAAGVPRPESGDSVAAPISGEQLDLAVRAAAAARPDLEIRNIALPTDSRPVYALQGQETALLVRHRANAFWVSSGGAVEGSYRGEALTVHQRISEAADPLHFGTWAAEGPVALAVKLLWFVAGLAMFFLSIGGIGIYGSRVVDKNRRSRA